ncbi:MAG TPA: family 78 glycoside hydrolase catalytic domain, partial [Beutenbergiaceae bacterium]|nr:family 78 glycoside hydrolase catalytic domain [Beutenbergiaceae bacterium]
EELPAISVEEPEEGVWVFDLGQNMVGRARVNISGNEGDTVRIRHAEVTHPDGNIAPENLRSAKATDYYTFAHDGEATYEPRFTFHGFRYVEITGVDEAPTVEDVTGVVLHTDGELTSSLETSDPMVNQLQSNIVWGQRGNFLSIPTDTPARDERLGWTGDINVFAPTATFNMDSASLLRKWMDDMRDAQLSNGAYPEVAPQFCTDPGIHPSCGGGSTGWADAGITVPWEVWQRYGDTQIIEENYDSMTAYIDFLQGEATNHIRSSYGSWGDWLNFDDPTPANVLATAFYAHSVDLMADMAEAIGRNDDAEDYRLLFNNIRDAYIDAFISEDGTINGNSQTGYAISIEFGLVPEELVEVVGDRLDEAVADRDGHLATGFLGTPSLLPALSRAGHPETSYQLLLNRTYPSWGFQIDRGATTMWERWDSIKEDGSFGDLAMNSFNHFAYGAVGDWMYRDVGGISIAEPGHKKTLIAPKPGGGLTHASATYESIHGAISSAWELTDAGLQLDVTIPANTSARV